MAITIFPNVLNTLRTVEAFLKEIDTVTLKVAPGQAIRLSENGKEPDILQMVRKAQEELESVGIQIYMDSPSPAGYHIRTGLIPSIFRDLMFDHTGAPLPFNGKSHCGDHPNGR